MKKHYSILFYGIIPPDNITFPWEDGDTSWEDTIAFRHKIFPPDDKFKGNEKEYEKYWAEKKKLIDSLKIKVEVFGTEKNPKYAFCIKDSIFYASQEFPEIVEPALFKEKNPIWDKLLFDFNGILAIEGKYTPRWYLCSYSDILS